MPFIIELIAVAARLAETGNREVLLVSYSVSGFAFFRYLSTRYGWLA